MRSTFCAQQPTQCRTDHRYQCVCRRPRTNPERDYDSSYFDYYHSGNSGTRTCPRTSASVTSTGSTADPNNVDYDHFDDSPCADPD